MGQHTDASDAAWDTMHSREFPAIKQTELVVDRVRRQQATLASRTRPRKATLLRPSRQSTETSAPTRCLRSTNYTACKSPGQPPSLSTTTQGPQRQCRFSADKMITRRTIRSAWFAVLERGPSVLDDPSGVPGHPSTKKALGPHITHCFDFIRQALVCFADATLEPFLEEDGVTLQPRGSSGWGVTHKCRNFDALVDWAQERAIFQGL
ncbi:hypothetical protein BK809_0006947 [Diplodia seriata]|uniref:Uncharacterized protein n=1 Tax=Diplodia seriata TaxID=420778 RepID=A0A1S8B506_9PEZI|nr:hypothetical protein BK809_0006947 [Diplodia seriata]